MAERYRKALIDSTHSGYMKYFGMLTQRSRWAATLGWMI
jgi:hypothetical protein